MPEVSRNNEIVRWEILAGLPGEGPRPTDFHLGHPTPWAEGVVIRFWRADGSHWAGNFQGRQDRHTKVMLWPEADSVVVIASGGLYLVNASNPDIYCTVDGQSLVGDAILDEGHNVLLVTDLWTVRAFGRDRQLLWRQSDLDGYDPQFQTCRDGVLTVEVEEELGGVCKPIRLRVADGELL